jgi:hypothetical protein
MQITSRLEAKVSSTLSARRCLTRGVVQEYQTEPMKRYISAELPEASAGITVLIKAPKRNGLLFFGCIVFTFIARLKAFSIPEMQLDRVPDVAVELNIIGHFINDAGDIQLRSTSDDGARQRMSQYRVKPYDVSRRIPEAAEINK